MPRYSTVLKIMPYIFLFPALSLLFIFKVYPILEAFVQSLFQSGFGSSSKSFVGFENYILIFSDPVIWNSIKVTLWLNILINPIQIILAFALAIFLNKKLRLLGYTEVYILSL